MSRALFVAAIVTIAALRPALVAAQSASGTVSGHVRDSSGASVPGALVRLIAEPAGGTLERVSDEQGLYRADELRPGRYRVETAIEGFETAPRRISLEPGQDLSLDVTLTPSRVSEAVVVTARRIEETAQDVPIPVSVMSGELVETVGAFNVNRVKDLIPTVQFYSTNPRNSAINIRGLGAPFGLTNDGIEPGVGLYIDGVFYARPAAATLDFLDVERIEVLRGPQGTLFGKNTTAGAINVTTRRPTFTTQTRLRAQLRQRRVRAGERVHLGSAVQQGRRTGVVLRHPARWHRRQPSKRRRGQRSQQSRRPRPAADCAVGLGRHPRELRSHASAARRLHPGRRRRRADAAHSQPAVPADRRRSWLRRPKLQRLRSR